MSTPSLYTKGGGTKVVLPKFCLRELWSQETLTSPKNLGIPGVHKPVFVDPRVVQTHTAMDTLLCRTFPGIHAP